jgi:membrane protein YqaA with SNARE-associated domain
MNLLENYALLFTDAIFANTVFYGGSEMVLEIMHALGGYNFSIMLIVAILGYAASVLINYWFGWILYKIYDSSIDNKNAAQNYTSLKQWSHKYGAIALCLNMIPALGPFLPVLASFLRFGLKRTLLFTIISRFFYYVVTLW